MYRYFQDGDCMPSWICRCTDLVQLQTLLGGRHSFAKFGWNRCSRFDTVKFLLFCEFDLKTPIQARKIGVLFFLPHKCAAVTMQPPKGIFGCENTSFGAQIVKIGAIVAEISRFFDIFKMAAVRHLGFVEVRNWTTHEVYLV